LKRSEINKIIEEARKHFQQHQCHLPGWAFWGPKDWESLGREGDEIRKHGLGWIVTDFGTGEFEKFGLVLFVARNGHLHREEPLTTKTYAEKFMVVRSGQITPFHFHWKKTEDLVNRSGGRLDVQLAWSAADELTMSDTPVEVKVDGIIRTLKRGDTLILCPGESVELVPKMCHQFAGHPGDSTVIAGEISSLNDDTVDNCFLGRDVKMSPIVEDAPREYLLAADYALAHNLV
jgi:D-lyxose ketol-isomerase